MTRIERLQAEVDKLYEYRRAAMEKGNLYWVEINDAKIKEKEAQLAEAKSYEKVTLHKALSEHSEEMKNKVYKLMLKASLAADFLNDCAGELEEAMKQCDIVDFSFKKELELIKQTVGQNLIFRLPPVPREPDEHDGLRRRVYRHVQCRCLQAPQRKT